MDLWGSAAVWCQYAEVKPLVGTACVLYGGM